MACILAICNVAEVDLHWTCQILVLCLRVKEEVSRVSLPGDDGHVNSA